jgi:tetratricopeptide (TPR) repeat protein
MTDYAAAQKTPYISASGVGRAAIGGLMFAILVEAAAVIVNARAISILSGAAGGTPFTAEDAASMEMQSNVTSLLQVLYLLIGGILFLMWVHRANRAASSFGTAYMEFTPSWAVGWWFIPIANLVRPYQAIREIWKASSPNSLDATSWQAEKSSPMLLAWWLFYHLSWIVPMIIVRPSFSSEPTLDESLGMYQSTLLSNAFEITAAVLAILVIIRINQRQDRKRTLLQATGGGYVGGLSGQAAYPGAPPADPVAHYNRGVGYYQANDMARAIEEYKEAIRLNPNFAEARYSLGLAYLAMGNREAASIEANRLEPISLDWATKLSQLIQGR